MVSLGSNEQKQAETIDNPMIRCMGVCLKLGTVPPKIDV